MRGEKIKKKNRRLAIEQQIRQYNAWFYVRRCDFKGLDDLDEGAFHRRFRHILLK